MWKEPVVPNLRYYAFSYKREKNHVKLSVSTSVSPEIEVGILQIKLKSFVVRTNLLDGRSLYLLLRRFAYNYREK
jgi:hypothetical protein